MRNDKGTNETPMLPVHRRDNRLIKKISIPPAQRAFGRGIGDYAQAAEPFQRYWETMPGNMQMPGPSPITTPPVPMDPVKVADGQLQARQIADAISCQAIFTKRGNWIEPPSDAIMIDQSTIADGISVPLSGAEVTVLTLTMPDRFYGVIYRFGNELETDVAFQNVQWKIIVNGSPLPFSFYDGTTVHTGAFRAQLGKANTPVELAMPIILKYNDTVLLTAQALNGAAHTAYARMTGWMYAVKELDGAGSVQETCQYTGVVPLMRGGTTGAGSGQTLY